MATQIRAALLFVDMLGVRASWLKNGRKGAEESFRQFQECIQGALKTFTKTQILEAVIESDSAVIRCRNADEAVLLACRLFKKSFNKGSSDWYKRRVWLRGVILPISRSAQFRQFSNISRHQVPLINFTYHRKVLDAISIEKSGFRGMRCLIKNNLVTEALQQKYGFQLAKDLLPRFRHLRHSTYPSRITKDYQDVLWMNPHKVAEEWTTTKMLMNNRLRYAGHNPEELNQAAATQIVFNECEAMIASRS